MFVHTYLIEFITMFSKKAEMTISQEKHRGIYRKQEDKYLSKELYWFFLKVSDEGERCWHWNEFPNLKLMKDSQSSRSLETQSLSHDSSTKTEIVSTWNFVDV